MKQELSPTQQLEIAVEEWNRKLKQAQEENEEILEELNELGIKPEDMQSEMNRLVAEIEWAENDINTGSERLLQETNERLAKLDEELNGA